MNPPDVITGPPLLKNQGVVFLHSASLQHEADDLVQFFQHRSTPCRRFNLQAYLRGERPKTNPKSGSQESSNSNQKSSTPLPIPLFASETPETQMSSVFRSKLKVSPQFTYVILYTLSALETDPSLQQLQAQLPLFSSEHCSQLRLWALDGSSPSWASPLSHTQRLKILNTLLNQVHPLTAIFSLPISSPSSTSYPPSISSKSSSPSPVLYQIQQRVYVLKQLYRWSWILSLVLGGIGIVCWMNLDPMLLKPTGPLSFSQALSQSSPPFWGMILANLGVGLSLMGVIWSLLDQQSFRYQLFSYLIESHFD